MKAGELFVGLGIKGGDKAKKEISGVSEALKDTKRVAIEVKVAILAAIYALSRFTMSSSELGKGLSDFHALTGQSTKELQQYENAARKAGISTDDVRQSVYSLNETLTKAATGQGSPSELPRLQQYLNNSFDIARAYTDNFYALEKFQEAAKRMPPNIAKQVLGSFGMSDPVIAGMIRGDFARKNMGGPILSDAQQERLRKFGGELAQIGHKFLLAFAKMESKNGGHIIEQLSHLADRLIVLAEKIMNLIEKTNAFEKLGNGLELLAGVVDKTAYAAPPVLNFTGEAAASTKFRAGPLGYLQMATQLWKGIGKTITTPARPQVSANPVSNTTHNHNNRADILIQGSNDPKATARETQREYNKAFYPNSTNLKDR